MTPRSFFVAVLGAAVAAAVAAVPAVGAPAELAGHRAVYSLSIGKIEPTGRFTGVKGAVVTNVEKACDAWITAERIKMRVDTRIGGALFQELDFTGWESVDGREFRFFARSRINDERKTYKGTAMAEPGRPGEARYSQPKEITMPLPAGVRFYFGLTRWIVENAQAGTERAQTTVFDGTDEDGPEKVTAFIVPIDGGGWKEAEKLGPLVQGRGWNVRLAFYPIAGRGGVPDYEVQAVILENGVTPRMELIFPGFTAIQKLESIEPVVSPRC